MNANELADELQAVISVLNVHNETDCLLIANDCQAMLRQLQAENDKLKKAIDSALGWVHISDREKAYTDPDMFGEMVPIRLSGLCVLATAIGKRDSEKILNDLIASHRALDAQEAKRIDDALGINRGQNNA